MSIFLTISFAIAMIGIGAALGVVGKTVYDKMCYYEDLEAEYDDDFEDGFEESVIE